MRAFTRTKLGFGLCLAAAMVSCAGEDEWPIGIETSAMDTTADPCEDFYRYACGGFLDANPLPSNGAVIARRSAAFFAMEDAEVEILRSPGQDAEGYALRDYHGACVTAGDGEQDESALTAALASIDSAATPAEIAAVIAGLHAIGAYPLFSFGSTRDLARPKVRMAGVGDASLGMPDRFYYLDVKSKELAAYRAHIQGLSALVGITDPAMADAVIGIETTLATAQLPSEDLRDPKKTFHPTDAAAFEASMPHFDWASYRKAVGAPSYTTIDVVVPASLAAAEAVLKGAALDDLKRYLRWTAIEALAGAMGDKVVREESAFHRGVFYGAPTPLPRDEMCLRATAGALPWAMGRRYVDRAFGASRAAAADELARALRAALDRDLDGAGWLDAPTRAAAKAKLAAMAIEVGGPSTWPSIEGLSLDPGSFVNTSAALAAFELQKDISKIGADDDEVWFMGPSVVNAAYSPTRNAVNLPAGILQAPLFDDAYAPVVRFGAMGSIVGHELTHGFDDQGRLFDATGKLADLWSKATAEGFAERAQCLVEQYDSIEVSTGEHVNGELTLGENIADHGGVKLAYMAAAPVEDIDRRGFFLAYAQSWCANIRPEYLSTLLVTDSHAPNRERVNAVLANTPSFAEAFACGDGAKMVRARRCEVW